MHSFITHGKHYGNVLVHCLRGVSRSASFVMGHLMLDREMTADEALAHVATYRSVVQPNEAFLGQLRQYDEKLHVAREGAAEVAKKSGGGSGSSSSSGTAVTAHAHVQTKEQSHETSQLASSAAAVRGVSVSVASGPPEERAAPLPRAGAVAAVTVTESPRVCATGPGDEPASDEEGGEGGGGEPRPAKKRRTEGQADDRI